MTPFPTTGASRVTVLMYHRLGEAQNDSERRYCVSAERFESHMLALERRGMKPCSIESFVAWLEGHGTLPPKSFVLTFDDGFLAVYEHAFPLLASMKWPATVFLVSGLIGMTDMWTKRQNALATTHPLLGRREILELAKSGFSIHSHSRNHFDLRSLSRETLTQELAGARHDLEELLGRPVSYLAYPYGWLDETVVEAARSCGYTAAFTTQPGFNRCGADRYRIRRIDVYGSDTAGNLMRKMSFGTNDGSWTTVMRYYAERAAARIR